MPDTPGDALLRAFVQQLIAPAVAEAMAGQSAATDEAMQRLAQGMAELAGEIRSMRLALQAAAADPEPPPPVSTVPEEVPAAPPPIITEPEPAPPIVVTPTPEPAAPAPQGGSRVEITSAAGAVWPVELPEAEDARLMVEVPAEIAGPTSLRLVVDHGRKQGVRWADVWLRNDISMRQGGGEARYSVRVVLDGQEVLRQDVPRHQQYRAWGRLVSAGTLPELPWPDVATLRAAGVANYAGPVDAALLDRYAATMASWGDDIWSPRGIDQYMPGVGGRDDIGPATASQAIALMTRDPRMRAYVIAQAEAAGGIPWHHWDARSNTWLRVTDYPKIWTDGRGAKQQGGTLLQPVPGRDDVGWALDSAHQPDCSFVAYLLTGRRAFLDNLQAQAAWNVIFQWSPQRGDSDMLVVQGNQVRGAAWALRQIDEAAWASPEGSVEKAYFTAVSEANWSWIVERLPAWTEMQGEAHGWLPGAYGIEGALPPWQEDYFASTAIAAARRGNADALTFLTWARNFFVGRFAPQALGHDGATYLLAISEGGRIFTTWAEIAKQTKARGWSNGSGWDRVDGNYAQWARWTLAGYADLFGDAEARRLYDWLPAEGAPFTQPSNYQRDPLLSVALS